MQVWELETALFRRHATPSVLAYAVETSTLMKNNELVGHGASCICPALPRLPCVSVLGGFASRRMSLCSRCHRTRQRASQQPHSKQLWGCRARAVGGAARRSSASCSW